MTEAPRGNSEPFPNSLEFFHDVFNPKDLFDKDSLPDEDDRVTVEGVEVEGGNELGENYGSAMTFANIKLRTRKGLKNVGVVMKSLKQTQWHLEIMNIYALFDKEVEFYLKTIPAIVKFQAERGVRRPVSDLLPRCLFAKAVGDEQLVITENLCQKGFRMADRHRGLGLRHSILALEALGRFHAASLAMKILEPEVFWKASRNAVREVYYTRDRERIFDLFYSQVARGKIEALVKSEVDKGVADADLLLRVSETADRVIKERSRLSLDVLQRCREPLVVINHGDFWVNNIMYRYTKNEREEEVPVAAKLVDFQMTRYASPSLDILTFLYTSTTFELRKEHEEELLQAYHGALLSGIQEAGVDLNSPSQFGANRMDNANKMGKVSRSGNRDLPESHPLSFQALKEDLQRHWPWGLMLAEFMLRIVLGDPSEAANTIKATTISSLTPNEDEDKEEKLPGSEMLKKLTSKACDKRYIEVIRDFAHQGYLDDQNIYHYTA